MSVFFRTFKNYQKFLLGPKVLRPFASAKLRDDLKSVDELPGPSSIPVFGAGWQVLLTSLKERKPLGKLILESQFLDTEKYGPIFKIDIPGIRLIQLSDPAVVAKLLRNEPKYPIRVDFPVLDYYHQTRKATKGVFFADGAEWYKLRSVISKRVLIPREVAEYLPVFNEIVSDFITRLDNLRIPDGNHQYEVKNIDNELFKWSFESVAHLLFDRRFGCLMDQMNPQAQDFIISVGGFLETVISVGFLPVWFYKIYETKVFKAFVYHMDNMNRYAEIFVKEKLEELEREREITGAAGGETTQEPQRSSFVEFLLSSDKITKDDLLASIIDLLFAGVDTTSNTMQWMLYMMAKNPEKQEKLFQEVNSVLEPNEQPSSKSLLKMPYMKAFLKETLRLYPVLSQQNRQIQSDMEVLGYHLPKGSHITSLTYYMGRDENNFKDASKFIPERWMRSGLNRVSENQEAFASIPFGFGTRMCAGRRIAELELFLLTSRLVQKYEIKYPENEVVEPFMRGVTIPDRPVRVKFVQRPAFKA